jgi:hypothetical protein
VFTETEAKQLRDNYNAASPAGKADFILGFGLYGSQGARDMMRQIAPTKPELARLAEMAASANPAVKQLVREAADGAAQPLKDGTFGRSTIWRARPSARRWRAFPATAARRSSRSRRGSTRTAARRERQEAARGTSDIANRQPRGRVGGAGGKGGMAARATARRVLPTGVSQSDFDGTLLTVAGPDDFRAAANGVPQWDGRDMHLGEFRQLTPVLVHDDGQVVAYAFRSKGGSGYVKTSTGADYLVDTHKLAQTIVGRRNSSISPENLARYGYVRK